MVLSSNLKNILNNNAIEYYNANKNNDKEKVNQACRNIGIDTMGWDCIGNGSGRNVFDMEILGYSDYVLKLAVPHPNYSGIRQNKHETKLWNSKMNSRQKEYVAPVINSGINNCWLVMPKGKSEPRIDNEWLDNAIYYLNDLVWEDDIQRENVVLINGDLKICDYGMPPQ